MGWEGRDGMGGRDEKGGMEGMGLEGRDEMVRGGWDWKGGI